MYRSTELEVWNLTPGGRVRVGALDTFAVVGSLLDHPRVDRLRYSLNGGEERPVYLGRAARKKRPGDFSIDTIDTDELRDSNVLDLVVARNGSTSRHTIPFSALPFESAEPRFELRLDGVRAAEEVAELVEGRWVVSQDEEGRPCIEMRPEDAGYDRLIAFGHRGWTHGYRVRARTYVTRWTRRNYFNLGLVFRWNPHECGGGTSLPRTWTGGLAYYAARSPGLRLRLGREVSYGPLGARAGSHVLAETPFSSWRQWAGFVRNSLLRIGQTPIAQLRPRAFYVFELTVERDALTLEVHEEGSRRPATRLVVHDPPDVLPSGCVGLVACDCAVRLYDYSVTPL